MTPSSLDKTSNVPRNYLILSATELVPAILCAAVAVFIDYCMREFIDLKCWNASKTFLLNSTLCLCADFKRIKTLF